MGQFQSAAHFASWAGLVPECNKSAGKKKSTKTRKGNKFLKSTLVECARSAIRNTDSFLHARYKKISARRGGKRAMVAVAHSMLLAIYGILKNKEPFRDLSSNYYNEINHDKILNRNIRPVPELNFYDTNVKYLQPFKRR